MRGQSLLVTGASGSFGSAFIRHLSATTTAAQWRRLIVYSRSESLQADLHRTLTDPRLRYFIGDVRDYGRLSLAMRRDVQVIVHAAALKRVETMQDNPLEAVQTNVLGSANVVRAAIEHGLDQVLLLSTDKAVEARNLYGQTKAVAEQLFLNANTYAGPKFSVVRYGNVAGSRGSVIPLFRECQLRGLPLPVTDPACTRFWITLPHAVTFVEQSLATMQGGELFVPRMPSVRMGELADTFTGDQTLVGLRPGEKLHEMCIGSHEAVAGLPSPYTSDGNTEWLTGDALKEAVACV